MNKNNKQLLIITVVVVLISVGFGAWAFVNFQSSNLGLKEDLSSADVPSADLSDPDNVTDEEGGITERENYDIEEHETEGGDKKIVQGPGFSLELPESWFVQPSAISDEDEPLYVWLYKEKPEDGYFLEGSDNISVSVSGISSSKKDFESLKDEYSYDEEWLENFVNEIRGYFNDPEAAPGKEDIKFKTEVVEIDGVEAFYAERICSTPCYIEGGAMASAEYLIPAGGMTYHVSIGTATDDGTGERLEQVREIMRTFTRLSVK